MNTIYIRKDSKTKLDVYTGELFYTNQLQCLSLNESRITNFHVEC